MRSPSRSLRAAVALAWVLLTLIAAAPAARGGEAAPAADPVLEQRVLRLAEKLRCLVCQNQTIADSNADLAVDLKKQIREKLKAGADETEIVDFMVQRYGDFVLYKPPLKATTWLLWAGPFALLLAGVAALFLKLRRRARHAREVVLTEAEHRRATALLERSDKDEGT